MANVTQTIANEIAKVLSGNKIYDTLRPQWKYLLESYLGGDEYRRAGHLQRYQTETPQEYDLRLKTTPLDNHCSSVVSVYTSFLFREQPYRDLGMMGKHPMMEEFLRDCDYEGRSIDHFMEDAAIWASVFGHTYLVLAKPNIGANTRADEIAAGVRPYISMLTPLYVLDWSYSRDRSGRYTLDYFKYIEEVNGSITTVKEWTPEFVKTSVVDEDRGEFTEVVVEENGLGKIPVVIVYNKRSSMRGIGVSDLADIADLQKFIYNSYSEVDQSIRLNTHPSLVKTENTNAGIGAGSIIHVEENLDPGLKPYLLEFNGASVDSIYQAIDKAVEAIDKIANTGAIRSTQAASMSGYAREMEFQLLNSKLSQKAHSIELAEEQIWRLWAEYMGYPANEFEIRYPGSFNVRDSYNDLDFYLKALTAGVPSERFRKEIYKNIADIVVGDSDEFMEVKAEIDGAATGDFSSVDNMGFEAHQMVNPETGELRTVETYAEHERLSSEGWIGSD